MKEPKLLIYFSLSVHFFIGLFLSYTHYDRRGISFSPPLFQPYVVSSPTSLELFSYRVTNVSEFLFFFFLWTLALLRPLQLRFSYRF